MPRAQRRQPGLSLLEMIVVIIIIGIIAAVAIPRFSPASDSAKTAALAADLRVIGEAIDHYTAEHAGRPPDRDADGLADTDGDAFVQRLEQRTDVSGEVVADGQYGPYLFKLPVNPINGKHTLRVGPPAPGENTHGWHYDPDTREIRSDDGEGYSEFVPQTPKFVPVGAS